jgi:flagellar motility protein MotE (MotC chaperone)
MALARILVMLIALLGLATFSWAKEEAHGEGEGDKKGAATSDPSATVADDAKVGGQRIFTPTESQILMELDQRRTELDRREQALELREKLVDLMEQRLNARVGELNALKADLEKMLGNISGKDDKEIQQLAAMYGAMKPAIAAGVLNKLDNAIVLDVLRQMPAKRGGKIMEALDPAKARYLSEMMADKTPPPVINRDGVSVTLPVSGRPLF